MSFRDSPRASSLQEQQRDAMSSVSLTGEQLEEYCLQHGLCPLCAQTKTHEKLGPFRLKLSGSSSKNNGNSQQEWKPITLTMADAIRQQQSERWGNNSSSSNINSSTRDGKKSRKKMGGLFGKSGKRNSSSKITSTSSQESSQSTEYIQVTIPPGMNGGHTLSVASPSDDSDQREVVVPRGYGPGATFTVEFKSDGSAAASDWGGDNFWLVYRGFCVRPGCFTLDQAKRLRGEIGPFQTATYENNATAYGYYCFVNDHILSNGGSGSKNDGMEQIAENDSISSIANGTKSKRKGGGSMSRLFGSSKKKNKDLAAFDPSMTGFSYPPTTNPKPPGSLKAGRRGDVSSGTAAMATTSASAPVRSISAPTETTASISQQSDDYSSIGSSASRRRKQFSGKIRRRGKSDEGDDQSTEMGLDDDASIGSAMTSESRVRTSLKELLKEQQQQQYLEQQQLETTDTASVMSVSRTLLLDLSHTRLHHVHVVELVQALEVAISLQTLILENCKLNDNELEVLGKGLLGISGNRTPVPLVRLSVRSNKLSNRGVVGLCPFFKVTTTLRELDLSKNQIGSRGASSVLHAFRDNPHATGSGTEKLSIEMINFAHNEIWDVDDGSFFAQNTTLKMFNLEGNFIHDEGVQSIADGLRINAENTKIQELYLGWNGIGDEGALHLAKMIETNSTIEKLGLGENDITSIGARALLNSLALNHTLRQITGLYHNMIDRKFVIESISRILYSHLETVSPDVERQRRSLYERDKRKSMRKEDTLIEPLSSNLPTPDEISEGELDWADRLYHDVTDMVESGVPLGEVARDADCVSVKTAPDVDLNDSVIKVIEPTGSMLSQFTEMPEPKFHLDRVMVFQAAPLSYVEPDTGIPRAIPIHDFDNESTTIRNALDGSSRLDATIDMEIKPGTVDAFTTFLESGRSRVLHFSGYGNPHQGLAFEDGTGRLDDSFCLDKLPELVKAAKSSLDLVVVNSFHSGRIGKAFLDAGVPRVVCCHHPETFRDKAASSFLKNFYRALATNKSLKQAFYHAQEAVRVEEISKNVERYALLPQKPEDDAYHDVPIFFTNSVPANTLNENTDKAHFEDSRKLLPKIPRYFTGREVDMCRVLDALRTEKIIRIGGLRGMGKSSLTAAVCRYVQKRSSLFNFDDVFWLPAARGVVPEEDTLFADLVEYTRLMMKSDHNISEDEDALECRDRIEIELEGRTTMLAIDSRKFNSEVASENLETFLSELINSDLDVKIILINSNDEEEVATVRLKPIDFKSTAILFGTVSRFITANGCPAAQSPDEYADLIVPPSLATTQLRQEVVSIRQERLLSVMGDGIPLEVIRSGKTMPANVFIRLIGMANTPEVHIESIEELEASVGKWTRRVNDAIANKNFFRAMDLQHVLKELDGQRSRFPSVEDMIAKEQELHRKHALCFKTRRYEEGNRLKREILSLKKEILREKRRTLAARQMTNAALTKSQTRKIADIQAQMASIMTLANLSFSSLTDLQEAPDKTEAVFKLGSAYHSCEVRIYPGNVEDFDPGNDLGASVCWTNECCDINLDEKGASLLRYGGEDLVDDVETLPAIAETPWGTTKCGVGNAVIVGPGNYDDLKVHCVILAVGPLSPNRNEVIEENDHDSLHYVTVMMRSCLRSSFILAKHSQVQSIAIPTITTKMGSATYETTLLTNLKLLMAEARFSDLNTLHIVADSVEESSKLIDMALKMGLTMSS